MDELVRHAIEDAGGVTTVLVDSSDDGRFFVLNAAGRLWSADGRLLQLGHCSQCVALCTSFSVPLFGSETECTIKTLAVGPGGEFAVIHTTFIEEDEQTELNRLLVVDLTASRPVSRPPRRCSQADHSTGSVALFVQHRQSNAVAVDDARFRVLPGLLVLRIAWHPVSLEHFGVLSNDGSFALYHVSRPAEPEQRFLLRPGRREFAVSAVTLDNDDDDDDASAGRVRFIDFAFGCGAGWDSLAVHFLSRQGQVFTLCPVAPFGMRVRMKLVHMLAGRDGDAGDDAGGGPPPDDVVLAYLQALTGITDLLGTDAAAEHEWREYERDEYHAVPTQPHALAGQGPALQGPMSEAPDGEAAASVYRRLQLLPVVVASDDAAAAPEAPVVVAALGTAATSAWAAVSVMVAATAPCWARAAVQCMPSEDGQTIRSVLVEVSAVTAPESEWPLQTVLSLPAAAAGDAVGADPCREVWTRRGANNPHRIVARVRSDLWDIQLPWMDQLAEVLDDGAALARGRSDIALLPSVANPIELGFPGNASGAPVAAAALLSHVLMGDAVVAVSGSGSVVTQALEPAAAGEAARAEATETEEATAGVQMQMEGLIARIYKSLAPPARPSGLSGAAQAAKDSTDALAALQAAIEQLSLVYLTHLHQAWASLHERFNAMARTLQSLGSDATAAPQHAAESQMISRIRGQLDEVQDGSAALEGRLNVCKQVQGVLNQRASLLSSVLLMNLELPLPLNRAERELERELAVRQGEGQELRQEVDALTRQTAVLAAREPAGGMPRGSGSEETAARRILESNAAELRELQGLQRSVQQGLRLLMEA